MMKIDLTPADKMTVDNLRYRWGPQLQFYSDYAIALAYRDFATSKDFGNNDEKFPEWFTLISSYEYKEAPK